MDATIVSYVWSVSDDGEEWTVVDDEDDETFGVTEDYLGQYIMVTIIDSEANTASDVTDEPVDEAGEIGEIEIVSAEATAANEITVTLANSVISSDTTIEVKKGTSIIDVTDTWNDIFDVVTLTAAGNLTEGEYTVTLTSKTDATNTDSADFEVVGRYVKEIVIDTDTALTDADKKIAYAHYDVFDQYGTSVRNSTSITWAGSATITGDKATGKLTLKKTTATDWIYGEQIYVTGVYTKTGISATKTLTVGQGQELDSLAIAGFVKKGTSKIVQTLPADFKDQTYYILFNGLDQNGVQLKNDKIKDDDVTFISDNVLVVKSISKLKAPLTIDGVEYCTAFVEPGIKVSDGGATTITAIANKTGNKTEIPVIVGIDQVVTSFTLAAPAVVVADGDQGVEIPFTALDQNGDPITNFVTIAKQETFNTVSFKASEGTLKLEEQANGDAKLTWSDTDAPGWTSSLTTDGIDRPISLTVVVVGGNTDNEMISVSDKRRPNGIIAVNMDEVFTEGAAMTFTSAPNGEGDNDSFKSFQFVDQYGQTIKGTDKDKKWGDSTGFLRATTTPTIRNNFVDTDLKGYTFGVRVTYAGSGAITRDNTPIDGVTVIGDNGVGKQTVLVYDDVNNEITFTTGTTVASVATGEGFKFEIARGKDDADTTDVNEYRDAAEWDATSPAKYVGVSVVDLSQIKSFTVTDPGKFYVGKDALYTGSGQTTQAGRTQLDLDAKTPFTTGDEGLHIPVDPDEVTPYNKEIEVKGTYNGKSVTIPAEYYTVAGSKITTATEGLDDNEITVVKELYLNDLYDKASAKGVSKDASDTLKVTLYHVNGGEATKNTKEVTYYDYADTATTATITAAMIDTDDQDGVDKGVKKYKIAKGTKTSTEITTTLTAANARLGDLAVALRTAGRNTAAGIVTDYAMEQLPENIVTRTLFIAVYDTTSAKVTLSDQDPAATTIEGLADSFTLRPTFTSFTTRNITDGIHVTTSDPVTDPIKVTVKDQYGAELEKDLSYRVTDIVENADAYAANNFTVSGNDSATITISGAERGDTFTLVLTQGGATASTAITVGADKRAFIDDNGNAWTVLKDNFLEHQRINGLG